MVINITLPIYCPLTIVVSFIISFIEMYLITDWNMINTFCDDSNFAYLATVTLDYSFIRHRFKISNPLTTRQTRNCELRLPIVL